MIDEVEVRCPTCFELVHVTVELGDPGPWIQDCDVCCRPIQVRVRWDEYGQPQADVAHG